MITIAIASLAFAIQKNPNFKERVVETLTAKRVTEFLKRDKERQQREAEPDYKPEYNWSFTLTKFDQLDVPRANLLLYIMPSRLHSNDTVQPVNR
jgi:hypothetical protein